MDKFEIRRGDIIISRDGRTNYVNDRYNYIKYFDYDLKNNENPSLDIVRIQRYVKVLWFYKLKTIYVRKEH